MLDSINDSDLQDLEAFLDGALDLQESAALQARLACRPELAQALQELRVQRAVRRGVWLANEPTATTVMRFDRELHGAVGRVGRSAWWRGVGRWGGAAAACVLMGIWIGNSAIPQPDSPDGGPAIASSLGGSRSAPARANAWSGGYRVSLLDETGRVQAVQQFPTLEQAREFADDIGRWHARRRQIQQGRVQLVAEQF